MKKISHAWQKYLQQGFINKKYWQDFRENAQAASVELQEIKEYKDAIPIIEKIIAETGAQQLGAVGEDDNKNLLMVYTALQKQHKLYTDKFAIVKNAPQLDIGFSTAEFGVGETGSVCVDNYAYEARLISMLPPINIVFMDKNNIVNTMTDAFAVLEDVFTEGYTGFVTGPSRTSDIERVLTLGVHGPSRFILFAVENAG
ncbi:LutC/YkgG family protein [Pectinatus brassicae]|uniref:L-lactate dehydrogenase complex protein LldG n=1 Tax=Pectinatus brassicae TaxID=862415 RepID=A0A840UTU0_9FIRM|nr:lactate utilization protein [Pectinatus brassicae]MBB5335885.1 L-lactate dehydrogenase complex protein LldG [Pectinatus brassicae]